MYPRGSGVESLAQLRLCDRAVLAGAREQMGPPSSDDIVEKVPAASRQPGNGLTQDPPRSTETLENIDNAVRAQQVASITGRDHQGVGQATSNDLGNPLQERLAVQGSEPIPSLPIAIENKANGGMAQTAPAIEENQLAIRRHVIER